jgi:hypothetical protein
MEILTKLLKLGSENEINQRYDEWPHDSGY